MVFQENEKMKKRVMKLYLNKYSYAVLTPLVAHSVGTHVTCSSSSCSLLCPNILHLHLSPFLSTRTLSLLKQVFSFSHSTFLAPPSCLFWYSFSHIHRSIRFRRPTFYRDQGRVFKNIIRIRNLPFSGSTSEIL
ncbi:hypothetical protein L873DRAFT_1051213 [Choiromyces venosus 120613-1]|uniref:Uncharacterized protein n=1 Tax=Choiromyces venosus 120613-1 TaxID=1336337 RepID=A0A3N4JMU5_9PEZI|nr:hypothetical protein L873DRAFT_1051213 [Choiromyces venosus 120613-1]